MADFMPVFASGRVNQAIAWEVSGGPDKMAETK
jgi:hypothetical protein